MGWPEQIRVLEMVTQEEDTFQRNLRRVIKRLMKNKTYKDASIDEMKQLVQEALELYAQNEDISEKAVMKNPTLKKYRQLVIIARTNPNILHGLNKQLEAVLQADEPIDDVVEVDVASDDIGELQNTFVSLGKQHVASSDEDAVDIEQQMEAVQDRLVELESRSMERNTELISALHTQLKRAAADSTSRTVDEWRKRWFGQNVIRNSPGLWWMGDERPEEYYHLKVMSWNILASSAVKWHHNDKTPEKPNQRDVRHQLIIQKIKTEAPDVVLLQEVDAAFIKQVRQTGLYRIIFQLPAEPPLQVEDGIILNRDDDDRFGNAILFNWKLDPVGRQKLIWNQDTRVYDRKNAILMNFKWQRRILSLASFHLSGRNKTARKKLWKDLIRHPKMKRHAIIGGDFNQVLNGSGGYSTCTFDYGNHEPALIDKIVITDQTLKYQTYQILNLPCKHFTYKKTGSDHFPVIASIEVIRQEYDEVRRRRDELDEFFTMTYRPWDDVLTLPVSKKKKKKKKKAMESRLGWLMGEDDATEQRQTLRREEARRETSRILREEMAKRRGRLVGMAIEGGCCIV